LNSLSPEPLSNSNEEGMRLEIHTLRAQLREAVKLFPEDEDDNDCGSDSDGSENDDFAFQDEAVQQGSDDESVNEDHDEKEREDEEQERDDEPKGRKRFPPESVQRPLFEGAKASILAAVLLLFEWKQENLISDRAFSLLLVLLGCIMLPQDNLLPRSLYLCEGILESQASPIIRDVCINECHLFQEDEDQCPQCQEPRFKTILPPFYPFPPVFLNRSLIEMNVTPFLGTKNESLEPG